VKILIITIMVITDEHKSDYNELFDYRILVRYVVGKKYYIPQKKTTKPSLDINSTDDIIEWVNISPIWIKLFCIGYKSSDTAKRIISRHKRKERHENVLDDEYIYIN